jgi:hypothetical protein
MIDAWDKDLKKFVQLANESGVKMLMVGGGAVNFHGYQRHSADVDWWIDLSPENLERLLEVFQKMDYEIDEIPESVKKGEQNISLKFSPAGLYVELITRFSVNKSFDEAYEEAEITQINNEPVIQWRVLSYEDLITSKIKSNRPKDLLDIQELQRINKKK